MSGKSWLDEDPEWQELKARIEGGPTQHIPSPKLQPAQKSNHNSQHVDRRQIKDAITSTKRMYKKVITRVAPRVVTVYKSLAMHSSALLGKSFATITKAYKNKPKFYAALSALLVIGLPLAMFTITKTRSNSPVPRPTLAGANEQGVLGEQQVEPEFAVLAPSDSRSDDQRPGAVRYDPQRKVASFTDYIGAEQITVSMQPLPGAFSSDTAVYVEKLAVDFYATDKITESNPIAFTGKNDNGVQTTIFSKNNLLVFILSRTEIDRKDLAAYITKLE